MASTIFKNDGGPISVELTVGNAQTGSYILKLWEATVNQIVDEKKGNFLNIEDDNYTLPTPNSANNGRRVQAIITVALIPPMNKYSASMTITQDGNQLVQIPISGTSDQPSVTLNLFTALQADQVEGTTPPANPTIVDATDSGTDPTTPSTEDPPSDSTDTTTTHSTANDGGTA